MDKPALNPEVVFLTGALNLFIRPEALFPLFEFMLLIPLTGLEADTVFLF